MPSRATQDKQDQRPARQDNNSSDQQSNVLAISVAERKLFSALFGKLIEDIMAETEK